MYSHILPSRQHRLYGKFTELTCLVCFYPLHLFNVTRLALKYKIDVGKKPQKLIDLKRERYCYLIGVSKRPLKMQSYKFVAP